MKSVTSLELNFQAGFDVDLRAFSSQNQSRTNAYVYAMSGCQWYELTRTREKESGNKEWRRLVKVLDMTEEWDMYNDYCDSESEEEDWESLSGDSSFEAEENLGEDIAIYLKPSLATLKTNLCPNFPFHSWDWILLQFLVLQIHKLSFCNFKFDKERALFSCGF